MMQKINIKKVTKEQMLKMLEEAQEKQEAAESREAELRGQIGELTAKLEENEKALEEVTAKYKSADHSAAMLRSRIDEAEKLRDQALEAHGEDMKAIEKIKNENRELAHLLGKRELELAEAKQRRDDALSEAAHLRGEVKAAQTARMSCWTRRCTGLRSKRLLRRTTTKASSGAWRIRGATCGAV